MVVAESVKIPVSRRTLNDIELLATGAFAPLEGFLSSQDYRSVLQNSRLVNGSIWPIPITLSNSQDVKKSLNVGDLVEFEFDGDAVATLKVEDIFAYDKKEEARRIFKTEDPQHPGVAALYAQGDFYVSGKPVLLTEPDYGELEDYHLTPEETRFAFAERGWKTIVGFQTRNPIHRAHEQITKEALEKVDGLLIHPLIGATKEGDIPAPVRMTSYEVLIKNHYPKGRVMLSVYPGNMYYAGPREALLHALVRKNYGCTHFIVGRDHAGVGKYYGPMEAAEYLKTFDVVELGITPLYFEESLNVSGSEIRALLAAGKTPPAEMMRPDVAKVLIEAMNK